MSSTLYGKASRRVATRYLQAAPLDGYYSMPSKGSPMTVGWGLEKKKEDLERATSFFQTRKDSWAIIVKPDAVSFGDVKGYVDMTPKLKRSKIVVVASDSLEGDDTHPDFVVIHDIIGHSIEYYSGDGGLGNALSGQDAKFVHWYLPDQYRIQDQDSDKGPDILAAIFFHVDPKDLINKTVRGLEEDYKGGRMSKDTFDDLKSRVERGIEQAALNVARWSSNFRPGVPRMIQLW